MIKRIVFNDIKAFKNTEIDNLSYINVFGGKNNIGKSSVLEMISIFQVRNNPSSIVSILNQRHSLDEPSMDMLIQNMFYKLNYEVIPTITCYNSHGEKETVKFKHISSNEDLNLLKDQNYDSKNFYNTYDDEDGGISISLRKQDEKIGNIGFYIQNSLVKSVYDKNREKIFSEINSRPVALVYSNELSDKKRLIELFTIIDKNLRKDELISILKTIDKRIIDISIGLRKMEYVLEVELDGIPQKVPMEFLGQGTIRFLSTIMPIMVNKNGVVCIDEIENGIHHSVFKDYWKIIIKLVTEYNVQLFITTHNEEILKDAIDVDSSEKYLKYYRLSRKVDLDNVAIIEYSYEKLRKSFERGWGIR